LRWCDRPPYKTPDRSSDAGFFFSFFFHPAMLELCRDQVKVESAVAAMVACREERQLFCRTV
jgi:hypothetical protein